jgi:membrane protease YdiL (CAAX protease family)
VIAYLVIAPVEELLFRGYIQSRLNRAFGRPYRTGGIAWGWGLILTALLFGVWHVAVPLKPPIWPHALWTLFSGLLFGYLRERSDGIITPSLLHGVMNYGPQALIYELLFLG